MKEPSKTLHKRRTIRLKDYDYSEVGAYYLTMCTHENKRLFGEIKNGEMQLNQYGKIVLLTWNDLTNHIENIGLGEFVVMPNHVHGIVNIVEPKNVTYQESDENLSGLKIAKTHPTQTPVSEIVRQFKTFSAMRINRLRKMRGTAVWQRDYYERIIRTQKAYMKIAEYIHNNPFQWENDKFYEESCNY